MINTIWYNRPRIENNTSMNLLSLLTLRYDPLDTYVPTLRLKDVSVSDMLRSYDHKYEFSDQVLENKIRSAIRRELKADTQDKVCIALSAGVDSNLILYLLHEECPKLDIECINVSFDETNEAYEAKKIAEQVGAGIQQLYVENFLLDLPKMINIVKQPRWNIYQYYFIKKSRSISDRLLTGDGGDEVFAGYTFRYNKFMKNYHEGATCLQRVQNYLSCHDRDWVPDQEEMFNSKAEFSWSSIYSIVAPYFDNSLHPLDQVLIADYNGKLIHDFIPTNDKYYRYFKVRGFSPLLDNDVIDLAFRMPSTMKYDLKTNVGKQPLRRILRIYAPVFETKRNLKVGYGMDLIKLWNAHGREMVHFYLDKGRIFENNLVNKNWYFRSLKRIEENNTGTLALRYISKLLQLLSLEVYYRIFVTAEMNPEHSL